MHRAEDSATGGIVYLNGEWIPRAEARVSVDDRGFLFGDGVYEVTRAIGGVLLEAEAHLERLRSGLAGLEFAEDAICVDALRAVSAELLEANGLTAGHATVYLQVTRGSAPRTHHFPAAGTPPTVYLSASRFIPHAELHERGAAAITHPDLRWARCDLKTVNLLPNVLAKQHAVAAGANEAILVRHGAVTEGSHSNVFGVLNGELRTYPRCRQILPGITRDVVLRLAAGLGVPVSETPVRVDELPRLEELFITGTTTDVMPIVRLDGHPVGDGAPGPITRRLQEAYRGHMGG